MVGIGAATGVGAAAIAGTAILFPAALPFVIALVGTTIAGFLGFSLLKTFMEIENNKKQQLPNLSEDKGKDKSAGKDKEKSKEETKEETKDESKDKEPDEKTKEKPDDKTPEKEEQEIDPQKLREGSILNKAEIIKSIDYLEQKQKLLNMARKKHLQKGEEVDSPTIKRFEEAIIQKQKDLEIKQERNNNLDKLFKNQNLPTITTEEVSNKLNEMFENKELLSSQLKRTQDFLDKNHEALGIVKTEKKEPEISQQQEKTITDNFSQEDKDKFKEATKSLKENKAEISNSSTSSPTAKNTNIDTGKETQR